MSIHHDLSAITEVAVHLAKEHKCNYNIIIVNHLNGEYNRAHGSTYEFVADSYFNRERPNAVLLHKTDDLIAEEKAKEEQPVEGEVVIYQRPFVQPAPIVIHTPEVFERSVGYDPYKTSRKNKGRNRKW